MSIRKHVNKDGFSVDVDVGVGAKIADGATVGKGVTLGDGVKIPTSCSLGNGVVVGNNTVVERHTFVGENSKIGSNARIRSNVHIGKNSVIGDGVVLPNCVIVGAGSTIGNKVHLLQFCKVGRRATLERGNFIHGWGICSWIAYGDTFSYRQVCATIDKWDFNDPEMMGGLQPEELEDLKAVFAAVKAWMATRASQLGCEPVGPVVAPLVRQPSSPNSPF